MIKTTKLFLALTVFLFAAACNSDDDATPVNDSIEGSWTAISFSAIVEGSTTFDNETTMTTSTITGSDMSYNWNLNADGTFSTNGEYTVSVNSTSNGVSVYNSVDMYSDVNGNGIYSTTPDSITIEGSLFAFEVNGVSYAQSGMSTAAYEINSDGQMVISQNGTDTQSTGGVVITNTISTTSVWERN